jgi:poly(A) polymerase
LNDNSAASGARLAPRIIPRSEHPISRSSVSPNALRVLYRLHEAGFQAFLVGGCVRDIMVGHQPKDFDVATNALPEEIRRLFRNCRLIGRRFRLAHVIYGPEVIEVATFRASGAPPEADDPDEDDLALRNAEDQPEDDDMEPQDEAVSSHRVLDERGRILRDNIYGTIDDDIWRRDFTANSLYYNIADFSVWDYCNGAADIAARRLHLIGDPHTRYREDPVRMLRAARFEAKLSFTLDEASATPIVELRQLLATVPPARLFDEVNKLFLTGHGVASLRVLRARGLFGALFPAAEKYLQSHAGGPVERLLQLGLENTDARVAADKPVTPVYLFALLLYGPIAAAIEALPAARWHDPMAILDCCDSALRHAQQRVTIPRRISLGVREMYALQPRLEQPRGKRALRLIEQQRFRAAYDLLLLRAQVGMAPPAIAQWWTDVQAAPPEQRDAMATAMHGGGRGAAADEAAEDAGAAAAGAGPGSAPRGRRRRGGRRRRRPPVAG